MYVPKSHYTPDLYTNGGELQIAVTQEEYVGYYWRYANGKLYTGNNPYKKQNQLLIPLSPQSGTFSNYNNPAYDISQIAINVIGDTEPFGQYGGTAEDFNVDQPLNTSYNQLYFNATNINLDRRIVPVSTYIRPTEDDYKRKEYLRYFLYQSHPERQIFEVSLKDYNGIKKQSKFYLWQFFTPIKIGWRLGGGTKEEIGRINQIQVRIVSEKRNFPFFYDYFKNDFTEFYKEA